MANLKYSFLRTKLSKTYLPAAEQGQHAEAKKVLLWDRKTEGGFPGLEFLNVVL
jgi:predicted Rdx family selenoprotein